MTSNGPREFVKLQGRKPPRTHEAQDRAGHKGQEKKTERKKKDGPGVDLVGQGSSRSTQKRRRRGGGEEWKWWWWWWWCKKDAETVGGLKLRGISARREGREESNNSRPPHISSGVLARAGSARTVRSTLGRVAAEQFSLSLWCLVIPRCLLTSDCKLQGSIL